MRCLHVGVARDRCMRSHAQAAAAAEASHTTTCTYATEVRGMLGSLSHGMELLSQCPPSVD